MSKPTIFKVKNFGLIKDIEVELNSLTIFTGNEVSGKDLALKLINVIEDTMNLHPKNPIVFNLTILFADRLRVHNLHTYLGNSYIYMETDAFIFTYDNENAYAEINKSNVDIKYIPFARNIALLLANLEGEDNIDGYFPREMKKFVERFREAREYLKKVRIPLLNLEYIFHRLGDYIQFKEDSDVTSLSDFPSSLQGLVALLAVMIYNYNLSKPSLLMIEDIEAGLTPELQSKLIEYIISVSLKTPLDKVVLTTNSCYILTSINNLITSMEAFKLHPEKKDEINNIVNSSCWIDYENVSAYMFTNGLVKSMKNDEHKLITDTEIDAVSEYILDADCKLSDIIYNS